MDFRERNNAELTIEEEEAKEEQLFTDVKALMQDDKFRRFMWQVIGWCSTRDSSFHESANYTNFRKGEQNIGNRLWVLMEKSDSKMLGKIMTDDSMR